MDFKNRKSTEHPPSSGVQQQFSSEEINVWTVFTQWGNLLAN